MDERSIDSALLDAISHNKSNNEQGAKNNEYLFEELGRRHKDEDKLNALQSQLCFVSTSDHALFLLSEINDLIQMSKYCILTGNGVNAIKLILKQNNIISDEVTIRLSCLATLCNDKIQKEQEKWHKLRNMLKMKLVTATQKMKDDENTLKKAIQAFDDYQEFSDTLKGVMNKSRSCIANMERLYHKSEQQQDFIYFQLSKLNVPGFECDKYEGLPQNIYSSYTYGFSSSPMYFYGSSYSLISSSSSKHKKKNVRKSGKNSLGKLIKKKPKKLICKSRRFGKKTSNIRRHIKKFNYSPNKKRGNLKFTRKLDWNTRWC
jgi:exonuclease VII large subunit